MHFILACKPNSHQTPYKELELFEQVDGAVSTNVLKNHGYCFEHIPPLTCETAVLSLSPRLLPPTIVFSLYVCDKFRIAGHFLDNI